jgi:hypothetical protein
MMSVLLLVGSLSLAVLRLVFSYEISIWNNVEVKLAVLSTLPFCWRKGHTIVDVQISGTHLWNPSVVISGRCHKVPPVVVGHPV